MQNKTITNVVNKLDGIDDVEESLWSDSDDDL